MARGAEMNLLPTPQAAQYLGISMFYLRNKAAQYLGISMFYLRNMRHGLHTHDGPQYIEGIKRGVKCYYYPKEQLDKWKREHPFRNKEKYNAA
jgi:hypothetical protein